MIMVIYDWDKIRELLKAEEEESRKNFNQEEWAEQYLQGIAETWEPKPWPTPFDTETYPRTFADSYSPIPGKALDVTAIEGTTMDLDSRIKYNEPMGNWKVLFNGKLIKHDFKSSAAAHAHLQDLKEKRKEPEYVK
jgi:hypothetical protein